MNLDMGPVVSQMMNFLGVNIAINKFACTIDVPNREHKRGHWDWSGNYHRRVQKKWNKRFGTHREERAVRIGNTIFMSQKACDAFAEQAKTGLIEREYRKTVLEMWRAEDLVTRMWHGSEFSFVGLQ